MNAGDTPSERLKKTGACLPCLCRRRVVPQTGGMRGLVFGLCVPALCRRLQRLPPHLTCFRLCGACKALCMLQDFHTIWRPRTLATAANRASPKAFIPVWVMVILLNLLRVAIATERPIFVSFMSIQQSSKRRSLYTVH